MNTISNAERCRNYRQQMKILDPNFVERERLRRAEWRKNLDEEQKKRNNETARLRMQKLRARRKQNQALHRKPSQKSSGPEQYEYQYEPMTPAERAFKFRMKLKEDPKKLMAFREKEKERKKQQRRERTKEQRIKDNLASKERQKRFRERQKQKGIKLKTSYTSVSVLTREERQKQREYWRRKKRESRSRQTSQERRRIREKDLENWHKKKTHTKKTYRPQIFAKEDFFKQTSEVLKEIVKEKKARNMLVHRFSFLKKYGLSKQLSKYTGEMPKTSNNSKKPMTRQQHEEGKKKWGEEMPQTSNNSKTKKPMTKQQHEECKKKWREAKRKYRSKILKTDRSEETIQEAKLATDDANLLSKESQNVRAIDHPYHKPLSAEREKSGYIDNIGLDMSCDTVGEELDWESCDEDDTSFIDDDEMFNQEDGTYTCGECPDKLATMHRLVDHLMFHSESPCQYVLDEITKSGYLRRPTKDVAVQTSSCGNEHYFEDKSERADEDDGKHGNNPQVRLFIFKDHHAKVTTINKELIEMENMSKKRKFSLENDDENGISETIEVIKSKLSTVSDSDKGRTESKGNEVASSEADTESETVNHILTGYLRETERKNVKSVHANGTWYPLKGMPDVNVSEFEERGLSSNVKDSIHDRVVDEESGLSSDIDDGNDNSTIESEDENNRFHMEDVISNGIGDIIHDLREGQKSKCEGDVSWEMVQVFQDYKISDRSNLKVTTGKNVFVKGKGKQKSKSSSFSKENIEVKEENADDQHSLLLPQCSPKPPLLGTLDTDNKHKISQNNEPIKSDNFKGDKSEFPFVEVKVEAPSTSDDELSQNGVNNDEDIGEFKISMNIKADADTNAYSHSEWNLDNETASSGKVISIPEKQIDMYICQHCGKSYLNRKSFYTHMSESHLVPDKMIPCPKCGKKFPTNTRLNEHMVVHTKIKAFECKICLKTFPRKSSFVEHMKYMHTKDSDKDYSNKTSQSPNPILQCPKCERTFKYPSNLRQHLLTHDRNYSCKICGIIVSCERSLKRHMKRHSDEKNHHCHICGHGFIQKCAYWVHMEKHHELTKTKLLAEEN